jgi:hypothetical protein
MEEVEQTMSNEENTLEPMVLGTLWNGETSKMVAEELTCHGQRDVNFAGPGRRKSGDMRSQ